MRRTTSDGNTTHPAATRTSQRVPHATEAGMQACAPLLCQNRHAAPTRSSRRSAGRRLTARGLAGGRTSRHTNVRHERAQYRFHEGPATVSTLA